MRTIAEFRRLNSYQSCHFFVVFQSKRNYKITHDTMKILYRRAQVSKTSVFVLVKRTFMCRLTKTSFYDRRKIFIVGGTLFMNIVVVLILWSAKTIRRHQKTFRLQAKLCWWPTMEHFLSIEPKIDNTTRRNSDNVHSARTTDFASGCWWAHLSKRHQRRW